MTRTSDNEQSEFGGLPEDERVPEAEDYLGRTFESDGVSREVDSINAIGSKFVVFNLRNSTTGEIDQVLKVLHSEFDPKRPLIEAFPEAANNMKRDPARVIRICERLLELDPTEETWAFNKGVAHLTKQEIPEALEAFELALSLAPGDIWNLIYRASCFAKLNRDEECLRDCQLAASHGGDQLGRYLVSVPAHADAISRSLKRIRTKEPSNQHAKQLLGKQLGISFRFRSLLHRLWPKALPR